MIIRFSLERNKQSSCGRIFREEAEEVQSAQLIQLLWIEAKTLLGVALMGSQDMKVRTVPWMLHRHTGQSLIKKLG